jgi:phosphoglycerol transferase
MFPTVLAAIGCDIEGDRLGLGTNLFSAKPALCEEIGTKALDEELGKRSDYYDSEFMEP